MPDYVEVATAYSNTNEESNVDVFLSLDGPPICPNMTDAAFREIALKLTRRAVTLTDKRLRELGQWNQPARARLADWFGNDNAATRERAAVGLQSLKHVLSDMGPTNFLRSSPELDRHLGCLPQLKNVKDEVAHVCAPNTSTHTICISPKFCTLPAVHMFNESKLATIIHEATHFEDTFASLDNMYGFNSYMRKWAYDNQSKAINNADSIALYIAYGEE